MEETVDTVHHRHRVRRRHKKRVHRPAKINPPMMALAIAAALLAALFCVWQIMKPSQAVETLESLQQFILLGASGVREGFLLR